MESVTSIGSRGSIFRILGAALLLLILIVTLTTTAKAQAPLISYQGMIASPDGKPMTASEVQITTTIYADENGTQPIWSDTYRTTVSNGVFSISLGSNTPLPNAQALDRPLWLGVTVANGKEMRPLTRLSPVIAAMNVADNSVTAQKLADNSVTREKIGADYVASLSLNGQRVAGHATDINIVTGKGIAATLDSSSSTLMLGLEKKVQGKGAKVQFAPGDPIAFWDGGLGTAIPDPTSPQANLTMVLHSGTAGTSPAWAAVNLATDVTSTLRFANGGTANGTGVIAAKWSATETGGNAASGTSDAVVAGGTGDKPRDWIELGNWRRLE